MIDFEIVRVSKHPDGAFGYMLHEGLPIALTLERTYDQEGGSQLVKIPPSVYQCRQRFYYRGGYDTYEIVGVPGHSLVLIHKGNVEHDSEGCILVGRRLGRLAGKPGVLDSATAFMDFMRLTHGRSEFLLQVREVAR